jgi:hypothetical protein
MWPRRFSRMLFDGTEIVVGTLPGRDFNHGRYHVTVTPGFGAQLIRLPFLAGLALRRARERGEDVDAIEEQLSADTQAQIEHMLEHDREMRRRERNARARARRAAKGSRKRQA